MMKLDLRIQTVRNIEKDFNAFFGNCFAKVGEPLYNANDAKEFFDNIGVEHYRLLACISSQVEDADLFDIGTSSGHSALALSFNHKNRVLTFNIKDEMSVVQKKLKWKEQKITLFLENLWEADTMAKWEERLLAAPVLFIDVDPHNGRMEYDFYKWLKEKKYKGVALFDDIHVTSLMETYFWERVPDEYKMDVTTVGHFSGTGIIRFPWSTVEVVV